MNVAHGENYKKEKGRISQGPEQVARGRFEEGIRSSNDVENCHQS